MTEPTDPIERSAAISAREAQGGGPEAMVASLIEGMQRQGRIIRYIIASVIFDIVISLVLAVVGFHVIQNTNSTHTSCKAGNAFRAQDHGLWTFILSLPQASDVTVAQRKIQASNDQAIETYLDRVFVLRDC